MKKSIRNVLICSLSALMLCACGGSKSSTSTDSDTPSSEVTAFESAINGAYYENGKLTYGNVSVEIPGLHLEDIDGDTLVNDDQTIYVYVQNSIEIPDVSIDVATEDGMKDSFLEKGIYTSVEMESYNKFKFPPYYVTYLAHLVSEDNDYYAGEVIIYKDKVCGETHRIIFEATTGDAALKVLKAMDNVKLTTLIRKPADGEIGGYTHINVIEE